MASTVLALITNDDLIEYIQLMETPSELEAELVQRLQLAIDMLEEHGLNT